MSGYHSVSLAAPDEVLSRRVCPQAMEKPDSTSRIVAVERTPAIQARVTEPVSVSHQCLMAS